MSKKFKKLPDQHYLSYPEPNDTKKVFYVGTSDLISEHRRDIFGTKYGIDALFCDSKSVRIYKIGATKNLKIRLSYYHKEIVDFRIIQSWDIKNPKTLEQCLISYFEKSSYDSYRREWFWDTTSHFFEILMRQIEWFINNSYTETKYGYEFLFKKER